MSYRQSESRTISVEWGILAVFAVQVTGAIATLLAQSFGWETIAYNLGIVIELPIIFYAILANATGIPFLDIASSFIVGFPLLLVVYALVAVVVAVPIHALYRAV